jgi:hypothetical protein
VHQRAQDQAQAQAQAQASAAADAGEGEGERGPVDMDMDLLFFSSHRLLQGGGGGGDGDDGWGSRDDPELMRGGGEAGQMKTRQQVSRAVQDTMARDGIGLGQLAQATALPDHELEALLEGRSAPETQAVVRLFKARAGQRWLFLFERQ